jgi:hypothetical protein
MRLTLPMSLLLIIPCFWQPHIQAGDLSSHLYNAWLASDIQRGAANGFEIVPVWTNVLADWILTAAVPAAGTVWSARLVAVPAVLIFFWGAFYVLGEVAGSKPWRLCPVLALFTYGLVFHFGFLNFYLSTGLSLWILGLLIKPTPVKLVMVVPIAVLAVLSHALPVIWVAAVFAYLRICAITSERRRPVIFSLGVVGIVIVRTLLARFPHHWSWAHVLSFEGFASLTALEQVWLFDAKYLLVMVGLAWAFVLLAAHRLRRGRSLFGNREDPWFEVWILHLFGLMILPADVQLPQYSAPLAFIPQRLSLFIGLAFCLAVCREKPAKEAVVSSSLAAVAFFAFLFVDQRAYNRMEAEVARVVRTAPSGARVVASVLDQGVRLNAMAHVADRACIGHCYSYANYQPHTKQFRIRLGEGNRMNAYSLAVSLAIESGEHDVTTAEDPIYAVCDCDAANGSLCLRTLHAGERVCTVTREISIRLSQ